MNRNASKKLESKSYRDALVSEHITQGLAFQIRATREKRGWSQEQLGKKASMNQVLISRYENPDYGQYTLATLQKLASALDVALVVRFVPFGELVDWTSKLNSNNIAVPSFDEELLGLVEGPELTTNSVSIELWR